MSRESLMTPRINYAPLIYSLALIPNAKLEELKTTVCRFISCGMKCDLVSHFVFFRRKLLIIRLQSIANQKHCSSMIGRSPYTLSKKNAMTLEPLWMSSEGWQNKIRTLRCARWYLRRTLALDMLSTVPTNTNGTCPSSRGIVGCGSLSPSILTRTCQTITLRKCSPCFASSPLHSCRRFPV